MRVLIAHNAYQLRGGEDAVVESEVALLREHGHEVIEYRRSNSDLETMSRVAAACDTVWSRRTVQDLNALVASTRPDVIHAHNTFPLVSPSLHWSAAGQGVPVVQTLHNFRLLCPQGMLLRNGRVCEDCVGTLPWRGVVRGCYRDSVAQSAVLGGMLAVHRALGTWNTQVSRFIALTEFCRSKFIEGGLPADRVVVKPNFAPNVEAPKASNPRQDFLFVGRLSPEKGLSTLLEAWQQVPAQVQLKVAGVGPQEHLLNGVSGVVALGALHRDEVVQTMQGAYALVMPSLWHETFGLVIVEAYAAGLPVIASRLGSMAELVCDGETGLLFDPGNPHDLANKMTWALSHPDEMSRMGQSARALYEKKFTAQANYRQLLAIYEQVLARS